MNPAPRPRPAPVLLVLGLLAACGGSSTGGTTGGAQAPTFEVVSIAPARGSRVALNQPVTVVFSAAVDLATVNGNTIAIVGTGSLGLGGVPRSPGAPASGTFELAAPDTVVFHPACPTLASGADAGLLPGMGYHVRVRGKDSNAPTVLSAGGDALERTATAAFRTRSPGRPGSLFDDPLPGPPAVVFRDQGASLEAASHLELALDPAKRVYFERDSAGNVDLPLGFLAPIHTRSRIEDRVAWLLWFDQPLLGSADNLGRVHLEWFDPGGAVWRRVLARVEVELNCGADGAALRLTPRGILPQGSDVRARIEAGFSDLVGEATAADETLALAPTATSFDPGSTVPGDDGDQAFAPFEGGGLIDASLLHDVPSATVGGGRLSAATDFAGTGGPGGDFDWFIPPGTTIIIDTTFDIIIGGPGGAPTTQQIVIDGLIDLRDMVVPATSAVLAIGPNALTILASGSVRVDGTLSVNGGHSPGVSTLNTTNQPEPGALGNAGGGRGGTGSWKTTTSTPRGGRGFGPYDTPLGGGEGGETSYAPSGKNDRRGAGGGGGGHQRGVLYRYEPGALLPVRCQTLVGLDPETGAPGGLGGLGAESQHERARGGAVGPTPFLDGDPDNDFSGRMRRLDGSLLDGEVGAALPGAGGGGGGDAVSSDSFPLDPFSPSGDEKGAGGGGGGGKLHVLALGEIVVGELGQVSADGGNGGGGENTSFFDRVGGGSGGGSGGSIVLESLMGITVEGAPAHAGDGYRDDPDIHVHAARQVRARGGQGGAGNQSKGGANENGPTSWRCDTIPLSHFAGLTDVPPFASACFQAQPDRFDPSGHWTVGAGGDGAPGSIQLHVPNLADLQFPAAGGDPTRVCAPPPVGYDAWQERFLGHVLPRYGARSRAESIWIPLGLARIAPGGGPPDQVELFFGGVAPDGSVEVDAAGAVQLEPPLVGPDLVRSAPDPPYVSADPYTMVFDAAGIAGFEDVVERNPMLLRGSSILLSLASQPDVRQDFAVVEASYDAALDRLAVTVTADGGALTDFNPGPDVQAALVPRSFRAGAVGPDLLGTDARVTIRWDATVADPNGEPDQSQRLGFTPDMSDLNAAHWDFVRFRIDFDLDPTGAGLDLAAPHAYLEHLRIPFRF